MRLPVFIQIALGLKREATWQTRIGPFTCVGTNMFLKDTGLCTRTSAVRTDIFAWSLRFTFALLFWDFLLTFRFRLRSITWQRRWNFRRRTGFCGCFSRSLLVFRSRIGVNALPLVSKTFAFRMGPPGLFGLLLCAMELWGASLLLLIWLWGSLGLSGLARRLLLTMLLPSRLLPSRQATMQGLHKMERWPQVDEWGMPACSRLQRSRQIINWILERIYTIPITVRIHNFLLFFLQDIAWKQDTAIQFKREASKKENAICKLLRRKSSGMLT